MPLQPIAVAFNTVAGPPPVVINPFDGPLGTGMNAGGAVRIFAMWGDDSPSIWVGGDITQYDGQTADSVVQVNNDGSIGTVCSTTSQNVRALYVDSQYVYAGYSSSPYFEVFDKSTGNVVSGFPTFDGAVRDIKALANGTILVSGLFNNPHQNFTAIDPSTKSLPGGFTTHTFSIIGTYSSEQRTMTVDSDDKILLGGPFTQIDSTNINSIVRLNNDGTIDNSFATDTFYRSATLGGGPYVGTREVSYNGSKQYLCYGAFFQQKVGGSYVNGYNVGLVDDAGVPVSTFTRLNGEVGVTANAFCVDNVNGYFYLQYGGTNQANFNGITSQNSNRTVLKFDLTNQYVGDGSWMTNNVTTTNDPIYIMRSQEEWGATGGNILLGGHQNFSTYNGTTGIGSIALIDKGNGALQTR